MSRYLIKSGTLSAVIYAANAADAIYNALDLYGLRSYAASRY